MKKIFFVTLALIICAGLHCTIYAADIAADNIATNEIDNLHKRFNICPVYSCLKGDNLYILTENGPEQGAKYGDAITYIRRGSEIGYYNLKTGAYTKLFVKYFKDNTYGAIDFFNVDDNQEYVGFTERVCVGQIQQNDLYIYKYSIVNKSADLTFYYRHFGYSAEEDKKAKSQIHDKIYFERTSKIASLLQDKSSVESGISSSALKFAGNKLFIIKDSFSSESVLASEIGYIDLDTDKYIRLFCKKTSSQKIVGNLKLLSAKNNEITFEDMGNGGCITYSYSISNDTITIIDGRFKFGICTDVVDSLKGIKIKPEEFKDIGEFREITALYSLCEKYPNIRAGAIFNSKVYIITKKYNTNRFYSSNGHELGIVDLKTLKYTELLKKNKEDSEEFNSEFLGFSKDKGIISFTETESNAFFRAYIEYEYSPEKNTLKILNAKLQNKIDFNLTEFNDLKGIKIKQKSFKDIEQYFKIRKLTDYINKYPSIKACFIANNKLFTISRNGLNNTKYDISVQAGEIGYLDLKTNRYTKVLQKVKKSEYAGELYFEDYGKNILRFSDNKESAKINYTLSLNGKTLKISDAKKFINDKNQFRYLIGKKLKLSQFKDISQYENVN